MTVRVRRDRWGIAHIDAPEMDAAFEAQGWVAADDRIWQMEWDRLRALGRWATVVGWAGVKEDAFFLRLGLADTARRDFDALGADTRRAVEAYARGVNRWLGDHAGSLPAEFDHHLQPPERWEPWHCVAVYKIRHIFMGTLYRKLWRGHVLATVGPDLTEAMRGDAGAASGIVPPVSSEQIDLLEDAAAVLAANAEALDVLPPAEGGSNSWALDGTRTASGRPILAGDPHRGIEFPNVYHQCHITCPDFDAIGLGFPGVPGLPHFGHNADVAWCITHGMADDTDLFVERFEAGGAPADWRPVTLSIRGEDDVEVWCGTTSRGPVVLGDPADGAALSMMWTGISGPDTTFDALVPMLRASSCDELEDAVRPWVIPVNSLLTADRDGDISFHVRGRVVERQPASRWTPVEGVDEYSWADLEPIPFDDLHSWRNPERGFLVTANNRIGDDTPYVSLDFAGPARFDRIVEILGELKDATVEDMLAIHTDVTSLVAPGVVDRVLEAATGCRHRLSERLLDELRGWDHQMASESVAASIYAVIRRRWVESVGERLGLATAELGAPGWPRPVDSSRMLYDAATTLLLDGTSSLIPGLESPDAVSAALSACVDETAQELTERLGPDPADWTWGRIHRMASPHPLASSVEAASALHPPVDECPGDSDTVRCGSVVPETGERAAAGSVARYVFDLADWDASGWVVPHGVSGVRGSGHDLDQRSAWLAGELLPMAYSDAAVAEVTVDQFEL